MALPSSASADPASDPGLAAASTSYDIPQRKPNYGRAAVESLMFMGLGTAYYWVDPLSNSVDWDDPSIGDRFRLKAVGFDTNLNTTNHFLHPGAGALIYGFSRVNGLSVPAAFGYTALSSLAWEFLLEWREKISINDLIYTGVGGVPLGEFFQHLSAYLNSGPPSGGWPQRVAATTLGFPHRVHAWIDGEPPRSSAPLDELGFSSAYGHAFRLAYDYGVLSNDLGDGGPLHRFALDVDLASMPGFLREGRVDRDFGGGNFTEMHLRLGQGRTGLEEADLQASATLFGHYFQDFERRPSGLYGHGLMIGVGSELRFHKSHLLGRYDQLSAIRLLGPHAGVWASAGPLKVKLLGDMHVDFGSIYSPAFPEWARIYGNYGVKNVLLAQGYAYGLGYSMRARGAVSLGPLEGRGYVAYGRYESIEGLDRWQETVTRDVHGRRTCSRWASRRRSGRCRSSSSASVSASSSGEVRSGR